MSTDAEWVEWGDKDPYYAVLSSSDFRGGNNRERFFEQGAQHFSSIVKRFERLSLSLDKQKNAVDYGCGVGRVLRPMHEYFHSVLGIDVSPAMIEESRRNTGPDTELCLLKNNDLPACTKDRVFEFVHSALVFQHIPRTRGLALLDGLSRVIAPGGKAMIQLPIAAKNPVRHKLSELQKANPLICKLTRFAMLKRNAFEPVMQMNVYPIEKLLPLWQQHGLEVQHLDMTTDGDIWQCSWFLYKPSL